MYNNANNLLYRKEPFIIYQPLAGMCYFSLACNYLYIVLTSPLILLGCLDVPEEIQAYLENRDQHILVKSDDICMITQEYFQDGMRVEQCNQCFIIFSSDAFQQWLKREYSEKKCIVCSYPYSWPHFTKGRALVVQQAVAVPPPINHSLGV